MDRFGHHYLEQRASPRTMANINQAQAAEYFEHFLNATTLKNILGYHRTMCDLLQLKPNYYPLFYPKLRAALNNWKAKALWKKLDARASHKCYGKGKISEKTRVLVIGAGPCGLRTAIEAQLLGAKVVVVEKRDRLSRNNVLHLWPFVIEDLRMLGAKKFFGKFCAGAIDHISIRQIQCILFKVALLFGVEIHTEISFENLIEPNVEGKTGWRADLKPSDHPVSQYEFDVIIGADGKRNTLQGFTRKEFRGKLAIAITANFINKRTEAEARVEEISGVAFIFNQKFFKDLYHDTGIDLENIVYYKDDTHYFVMTAKKPSLIEKGAIIQDLADTERLLAQENVNREALLNYAKEAADFSTNYQMPDLEFAVNHYGQPDVAMFDFTSMYAAENASKIVERNGYQLLMILVGDSLLEPFWPTGSGCARGFLSSLDAAWSIRTWSVGKYSPLDVLAERESIYRLLAQTTPDNLNKDWKSYTLDPATRYPNLNRKVVLPHQLIGLFDTDNIKSIEKVRRLSEDAPFMPKKRRRDVLDTDLLINWVKDQVRSHDDITISDIASIFRDGKVLCAILNHYRPDLLDYTIVQNNEPAKNNQIAIDIFEKEIGIPPIMTGQEITNTEDYLSLATYLTQIYDTFRVEIPHIKHPKLELPESKITETTFKSVKVDTLLGAAPNVSSRPTSRHKRHVDVAVSNKVSSTERKTRKRRSVDKCSASVEERQKALEEIVANRSDRQSKRKQQRKLQTEQFLKSMQMLQANAKSDHSEPFEDYSLFVYRQTAPNFEDRVKDLEKKFTYVPDYENKLPTLARGNTDEDFAARIKSIEDGWQDQQTVEKKPKDLLRAIGKIETSDWNIREIEKKINENKLGKPSSNKDKEKVPKWSKEQFVARQTKMEKQHLDRQDSSEAKYADIDKNIRHLELKLKEGTSRDLGQNKVATLTEKLGCNVPEEPKKLLQRSNSKPMIALPTQGGSEFCHFCNKRVYLMERLSAEGRFFHHGCFKCQYCSTQLRLGSYAFDREGVYGLKFYCKHHDGLQGKLQNSKVTRKPSHRQQKSPDKRQLTGVSGLDLLDRVQTPERIEFSNLSASRASSDHEESFSQMDEDEWTDRNFRASTAEIGSSDDESSCYSESDSDDGELYEEALEEPATKEGTLKWAERIEKRHSMKYSSSDSSIDFESSTDDDDTSTATEGEEEIRARELRRLEVQVAPVPHNDTGTDTEVVSGSSDSSSQIQNSATEISTDSEFAQDDPTPIVEVPAILSNDYYVTKTRGSRPRKLQVTTGFLQKPFRNKALPKKDIELKLSPLVHAAQIIRKPAPSMLTRTEGYALNRTQSTGGIATKKSLELKRKYLLDGANIAGTIQKSGSASTLDTKFKSFRSNISDCQKLLKPATEISASMQTFCNKLDQHISPVLSPEYSAKETVCEKKLPPDLTNVEVVDTIEETPTIFENVNEGRPRSPVHETSIIVPDIDWTKKNHDHSADSLSLDSSSDNLSSPNFKYANIPTVEIHEPEIIDDLPPDSLCIEVDVSISRNSDDHSVTSDPLKSISSEKKILNQPKSLPEIENDHIFSNIHNNLHQKKTKETDRADRELSSPEGVTSIKNASGRSTPNSLAEQLTTALTETELSDWARDGVVSDDLEDDDFDLNLESEKLNTGNVKKARLSEFEDFGHVCGKFVNDQAKHIEPMTTNLDGIEFMDTGTESSSDDGIADARNGYVLFKDEDELAEDSLAPILNDILEAKNVYINQKEKITNSGYCVIAPERNNFGGEVIDLKPSDVENLRLKQNLAEHEDDSLLILDTGTTTEENTCSDSTVKNLMEIPQENNTPVIENNNLQKFRLEEKLAQLKKEHAQLKSDNKPNSEGTETSSLKENNVETNNIEFEEHCQRLQSKVDFGNAKDSIDIKKSRRKSKDLPQKPDLIQEEKEQYSPNNTLKDITLNLTPTIRTPDLIYKKEIIEKERDVNQRLVQEMVMSKMRAENKPERKRRSRIASSLKPFELTKSATTDIVSQCNLQNLEKKTELNKIYSPTKTSITPDVLLSTNNVPLQKSETVSNVVNVDNNVSKCTPLSSDNFIKRPLSVFSTFSAKDKKLNLKSSLTDLTNYGEYRLNLSGDNFRTPVAPLRAKHDEIKRTAEKLKSDARARARLLSNEDLGLSPEDKLLKLKEKAKKRLIDNENVDVQESIQSLVMNTERRNSWLYSNDTLNKKSNNSFRRSKSGDNSMNHSQPKLMTHKYSTDNLLSTYDTPNFKLVKNESMTNRTAGDFKMICHSDPNLLDIDDKKMKKKPKDKEPKKATKFTKIMDLFSKKSPKGLFSKISPKTKVMSKSCLALMDRKDFQIVTEEPIRSKSFSEISRPHRSQNHTPPPIPPLPLHYTGSSIKGTDDSSDGDPDWRREDKDSCDTLDHSGLLDVSLSNLSGRRAGRGAKRAARQSQLKRHRMAQEIQRKLEETEVKTKELEERGVMVERALRGEEVPSCSRDESDLLQEWFDLMRDRTELRRYEKGLTVRAEELELEDRHARLQQQLRERLENSEKKTEEEMGVDHSIINEMMEIVSKRDSLISVLEEDRVRYSTEDRDFEEQILAKGIQLTPIKSLDK